MAKWNRGARPSIRAAELAPSGVVRPPLAPVDRSSVGQGPEMELFDRAPGEFCFARWKNVVVQAWAAQANAVSIARLRQTLSRVAGSGVRSSISVIADGLPPPTPEARAGFIDLMNSGANEIACLAIVVQGTGFASSALRSAVTGMRVATMRTYEMAILSSVEELGPWLPPRHLMKTGVELDPARLCEVVRDVTQKAVSTAPMLSLPPRAG